MIGVEVEVLSEAESKKESDGMVAGDGKNWR